MLTCISQLACMSAVLKGLHEQLRQDLRIYLFVCFSVLGFNFMFVTDSVIS